MTCQINIRLSKDLEEDAKEYTKELGYKNIQELITQALREKIYAQKITRLNAELAKARKGKLYTREEVRH